MSIMKQWWKGRVLIPAFLVLLAGCVPTTGGPDNGNGNDNVNGGGDGGGDDTPQPSADALPDFSLPDVNPNSPSFNEQVSPRDHLAKVTAWYFGHAT